MKNETLPVLPSSAEMQRAFAKKDAGYDGVFFVAVRTTRVFCRPSCPSRPDAANVNFFASAAECETAGYRACKRCRPLELNGEIPAWVAQLQSRVEDADGARLKAADLRALGVSPERARRWFRRQYGMSFAAWCRGRRLAQAFSQLRGGASLDDVTFTSGFESHSGFREAFRRAFGEAPGRSRRAGACLRVTLLESPLGPLLAGATDDGLGVLDYFEPRKLPQLLSRLRRRFACGVVPGTHLFLEQLRAELKAYFAGARQEFTVPLAPHGTPFQQRVWRELQRIPFGQTLSYGELARRIRQPEAQRAVARANALNAICILIPCHRVIGKDGTLTGYGGGLWRKQRLLALERNGRPHI